MSQSDELQCAFDGIGREVGNLVRCLVAQEMAMHTARLQALTELLSGGTCIEPPATQTQPQPNNSL